MQKVKVKKGMKKLRFSINCTTSRMNRGQSTRSIVITSYAYAYAVILLYPFRPLNRPTYPL